jgi:hypothetical protein
LQLGAHRRQLLSDICTVLSSDRSSNSEVREQKHYTHAHIEQAHPHVADPSR